MEIANILVMILALLAIAYSIVSTIVVVLSQKKGEPEEKEEEYGQWPEEGPYESQGERQGERQGQLDEWQDEGDTIEVYPVYPPSKKPRGITPPLPPLPPQEPIREELLVQKLKEALPPQKRFTGDKFAFETKYDAYETKTAIEDRSIEISLRPIGELVSEAVRLAETEGAVFKRKKRVLAREMFRAMPQKNAILVAHELFKEPHSLRSFWLPWNK